ncbi:MAG: amidohydrolase [Lachnospiraceae bacterium]|nr:amidohydrolase [Candidatus Equihabitans merdae]
MMGKILIKNAKAIVSCDALDTVYRDCDMLIENEQILDIAPGIECPDAEVIDATDKFVYPGMINTHHHFFQTFVRNLTTIDYPNMTVPEWLDIWFKTVRFVDNDVMYYSSCTAIADLLKHGCTTAFDHHYVFNSYTGKESADREFEAAKDLGIRFVCGRATNTLPKSMGSSIPDDMHEETDEFIDHCRSLIKRYHDDSRYSMSQVVIAPCQPMNSYEDTFTESLKLAKETGCHLHTHLGEGESEIMKDRWGVRTVEWCRQRGFLGENVWLAHCWELTSDEYKVLGDTGTGVSHCPGPAVLAGFPILPMKEMMSYGINISLGCDGAASNDSSNLLDSVRMAFLAQCYFGKERGGAISAYDILKLATVNGAKTLGRPDLGHLAKGMAADLFMIDAGALELAGAIHDPKNILGRCGVTGDVWLTMVNGKVVFKDHQLIGIDEKKLAKEGDAAQKKCLRDVCEAFEIYR